MKQAVLAWTAFTAVAVGASVAAQSRDSNAKTRDVIVSVSDSKGAPVKGLGVADFAVREDNVAREVLKVEPATGQLQIVMLLDDSQASDQSIQPMREGLTAFVDKLGGKA